MTKQACGLQDAITASLSMPTKPHCRRVPSSPRASNRATRWSAPLAKQAHSRRPLSRTQTEAHTEHGRESCGPPDILLPARAPCMRWNWVPPLETTGEGTPLSPHRREQLPCPSTLGRRKKGNAFPAFPSLLRQRRSTAESPPSQQQQQQQPAKPVSRFPPDSTRVARVSLCECVSSKRHFTFPRSPLQSPTVPGHREREKRRRLEQEEQKRPFFVPGLALAGRPPLKQWSPGNHFGILREESGNDVLRGPSEAVEPWESFRHHSRTECK